MNKNYCVYILASRSRTLYTGVTNDLMARMARHRAGKPGSFTMRYRIHRLVHFETFGEVRAAIAREKEIKHWPRSRKIALIEEKNPGWNDLAERYFAKFPAIEEKTDSPSKNRSGNDTYWGARPAGQTS